MPRTHAMPSPLTNAREFFLWDYDSTLFPLTTNKLIVDKYSEGLRSFVQDTVLVEGGSFQPQQRVFASKRGWFLRRTVKLDPVAEFFLYDLIYRNRTCFRASVSAERSAYGFRITKGFPLSTVRSYATFKKAVSAGKSTSKFHAYFDIAAYFNHVYHHDLVRWFEEVGASTEDVQLLGKYLREICSGRSVDCLPHGLYPAKMIGSGFLSFLEASNRIRASKTVRLMDDIWLFDDDSKVLVSDALRIQSLLGDRGLSLNDKKSSILGVANIATDSLANIDDIKIDLLRKRRDALTADNGYGDDEGEDDPD